MEHKEQSTADNDPSIKTSHEAALPERQLVHTEEVNSKREERQGERAAIFYVGFLLLRIVLAVLFLFFLLFSNWGRNFSNPGH